LAIWLALIGAAFVATWCATLTQIDAGSAIAVWMAELRHAGLAGLWWMAALGFGRLWPWDGVVVRAGCGVAAIVWLDMTLGSLGWLTAGGGAVAWAITLIGAGLAVWGAWRGWGAVRALNLGWLAVGFPAIGVVVVAASSAPGWLWATEFGGYDALSYHLQLPREWFDLGLIRPLDHNVYSFFPSAMESAFLHVMMLAGGAHEGAVACQWLHTGMVVLAVGACASAARVLGGGWAALGAAAAIWGVPWCIVAGSLAYNDMMVVAMLACVVRALAEPLLDARDAGWRSAAAVGALVGAACAAKLTGVGIVAAPLAVAGAFVLPRRLWFQCGFAAVIATSIMLAPMLVRNGVATGNPIFPFATGLFGVGHWDAEQASRWAAGHRSAEPVMMRAMAFWNEGMRYGLGPAPSAEPWRAQWSLAWWAAPLLGATAWGRRGGRSLLFAALCLAVQVVFWLGFTHLKSRFLLPCIVPLAIMSAMGVAQLVEGGGRIARVAAIGVMVVWSALPIWIFATEREGAPAMAVGQIDQFTGDAAARGEALPWSGERLARLRAEYGPAFTLNHTLGEGARVLAEGEAAPFWFRGTMDCHTTWDRGEISRWIEAGRVDWCEAAREAGYTHVLLNTGMLSVWKRSGWIDPRLEVGALVREAGRCGRLVAEWPGVRLYALR
jgi:hypothetical protein